MVSGVKDPVGGVVVGFGGLLSYRFSLGQGEARASLAGDTRMLAVLYRLYAPIPPSPDWVSGEGGLVSAAGTTPCL